jgi:DivIVA domain-containing protein
VVSDRLGNAGLGVSRYTHNGASHQESRRTLARGMGTGEEGALMRTRASVKTAFRPTRFRAGYATDEVDRFVEAVHDALHSRRSRLGSIDVAYQRFTPVLFKPGYHMDDVDDYLTEAKHQLEEREYRAD